MSSGGWEIVGKKSKSNGKPSGKPIKAEKVANRRMDSPKLEDVLPLNEVKSLFNSLDANKENKRPSKDKDKDKDKDKNKKKKAKGDEEKKKQRAAEAETNVKRRKDKSESSTKTSKKTIADEMNELLERDRMKFPDAPLIWLKDLVCYLDAEMPAGDRDDPGLRRKPDGYPLSLLSESACASLERTIRLAGSQNAQLCWEGTLASMVKNVSEGKSDTGCRIFLQLLARSDPEMTRMNLAKLASLRNSYQNKKPVGLSLLWAFAQSARTNLDVGLTVWHEIMAPMLESRSYASYVIEILNDMLTRSRSGDDVLTLERYSDILEDLCRAKIDSETSVQNLTAKMIESQSSNLDNVFRSMMAKLTPKTSREYIGETMRALGACLAADSRCLSLWTSLFPKNLHQSDLLLKRLAADWETLAVRLERKPLRRALEYFRKPALVPKKGREETLVLSCQRTAEALIDRMSVKNERQGSFPFKRGIIILAILIGAAVTYDCQRHGGSFQASSTGVFIESSGLSRYGTNGWSAIARYRDKTLGYLEENYPEYYRSAAHLADKYARLVGDSYLVARRCAIEIYLRSAKYIAERKPLLLDNIEHHFPGLLENVGQRTHDGLESIKVYSGMLQEYLSVHSVKFIRWLETNVFVGNLSPENVGRLAKDALLRTQQLASQGYDWVYEQVKSKIE